MKGADLLPASVLKRKAVVYVRQSTQSEVMINLESQRRQYDLVEVARQHGFMHVEVIDDDMGADRPAEPLQDLALIGWLDGFVLATPVPSFASMPRGSPAMAAIGTICWSYADWWMPASSTRMVCTIQVTRMTDCSWA
jgi:hypothetical protein